MSGVPANPFTTSKTYLSDTYIFVFVPDTEDEYSVTIKSDVTYV